MSNVPLRNPVVLSYGVPWGLGDPYTNDFSNITLSSTNIVASGFSQDTANFFASWKTPENRVIVLAGAKPSDNEGWSADELVQMWQAEADKAEGISVDELLIDPPSYPKWTEAVQKFRESRPDKLLSVWLGNIHVQPQGAEALLGALNAWADYVIPEIYYWRYTSPDYETNVDPFGAYRLFTQNLENAAPGIMSKTLLGMLVSQAASFPPEEQGGGGDFNPAGPPYGDFGYFVASQIRDCVLRFKRNIAGFAFYNVGRGLPETIRAADRAILEVPLEILVHLQDIGDLVYPADKLAGTRGQSRRLEGFQIRIDPPVPGLTMRYMAHLQDIGDTPWVDEGRFVGTRGESRRLEGFAIQLAGPLAEQYDIRYMAHLQDFGDTQYSSNGEFCGTRGQSRRVEGIRVRIDRR